MAKQKTNEIIVSGYLKENNLEVISSNDKGDYIRGSLVIAVSDTNSLHVQFNVHDTTFDGSESKDYKNLLELLPEKAISIASYLQDNPGSDYEDAKRAAAMVWARGVFDEYTRFDDDKKEITSVQLRGYSAGYKKEAVEDYKPHADFTARVYISKLDDEVNEEGNPTGRVILTGLLPKSDQSVVKLDFVAPAEDGVAEYIKKNYAVNGTVVLYGDLTSSIEIHEGEDGGMKTFGRVHKQTYTKIINERIITGGSSVCLTSDMDGAIKASEIKLGLAKRLEKIEMNSTRTPSKGGNSGRGSGPAAKARTGFGTTKKGFSPVVSVPDVDDSDDDVAF